ncbi:hybrid sensor histidine kinase/response regulator [Eleftheria terrae]|uniref:hybrid sensor histidine kinase/response regulator n=1 Tax=Eleftheria terrae TaxID=1597781 RepID=UPI00263AE1D4|nr:response regulator [Eleftheria terrae]WKB51387.1 response regulator [Eleftheria terrae]
MSTPIHELLHVLQEEFTLAAPDIDAALMQWLSDPAAGPRQAEVAGQRFARLAQAARMIQLEGLAIVLELLRDSALVFAELDGTDLHEALGWLLRWHRPLAAVFEQPGEEAAVRELGRFVAGGPVAPTGEQLDELLRLLRLPPSVPPEMEAAAPSAAPQPLDDREVSLEVPDDVDPTLLDAFLDDAPIQLDALARGVRALADGRADLETLQAARRAAHTFKGSGNVAGIRGIGRLGQRMEELLDHAVGRQGEVPVAMARDLEQAVACLDQMVQSLRGHEAAPDDALAWLERLGDWVRAIEQGSVERLSLDTLPAALALAALPAAPREAAAPGAAVDAAPEQPNAALASLRIGVDRLDRLVRSAAQGLLLHGRLEEHLRVMDDRLEQLEASNAQLKLRLAQLAAAIDGHAAPDTEQRSELQALLRFAEEMAADELEHAQAARGEARAAQQAQRQQGQALVQQHRELMAARLVPVRQVVARLRRALAQAATVMGKQVRLEVEGEQVQVDTEVLDRLTEPLLQLLRNAADHGIEPPARRSAAGKPAAGTVLLRFTRESQLVRVECHDDGAGLDLDAIRRRGVELGLLSAEAQPGLDELARLILLPGFSTKPEVTDVSGRGLGLDVVADRLRAMKGRIDISSEPGAGTRICLQVPASTGLQHALLVQVEQQVYALPSDAVVEALAPGQGSVVMTPAGTVFRHGGREWPYQKLATWLGLAGGEGAGGARPVVLARAAHGEIALEVDRIIESRELILQDIGRLLRRLRGVAGASLRPDGKVLFLLDLDALEQAAASPVRREAAAQLRKRMKVPRKHALVVDDAISVRKTIAQLLRGAGYDVTTARDGYDALDALVRRRADIVLTDLEMPNLNGLDLTRRLRESRLWKDLPVMMITSRATNKHLRHAEEAGVNVFLSKPYADDELLAEMRRLLAGPER